MHSYAAVNGGELAHYVDTTGCKSLLDFGCGPGTYAFYLGIKNPELQLYLLDFPGVLQVAKEYKRDTNLRMRSTIYPPTP